MNPIPAGPSFIGLLLDESGSMRRVEQETKEGIKSFIKAQQELPGEAFFTMAQFNREYRVIKNFSDLRGVNGEDIAEQFQPEGGTALYDAIGQMITDMELKILKRMESPEKSNRVIIAIMTDGQDNSSRDYTVDRIKSLVEEKKKLDWQFLFLSADLSVYENSEQLGFDRSSTIYFNPSKVEECLLAASFLTSSAREGNSLTVSEETRNRLEGLKPFEASVDFNSSSSRAQGILPSLDARFSYSSSSLAISLPTRNPFFATSSREERRGSSSDEKKETQMTLARLPLSFSSGQKRSAKDRDFSLSAEKRRKTDEN